MIIIIINCTQKKKRSSLGLNICWQLGSTIICYNRQSKMSVYISRTKKKLFNFVFYTMQKFMIFWKVIKHINYPTKLLKNNSYIFV